MEQYSKKHDLLVERISETFITLYQGTEISKSWLCQRFNITERTAYRDLARLASVLDEIAPGKYRLSKERIPRLSAGALTQFASFTDVAHLFPGSDSQLLRDFMANESSIAINGHTSRHNNMLSGVLKQLRAAINKQAKIDYQYKGKLRQAAPYKLINQNGLWYLAAVEKEKLKSFEVGLIESLNVSDQLFYRNPYILEELKSNIGISFGQRTAVTLQISSKAAPYISRRELFPEQRLLNSEEDGSLTISISITNPEYLFRWLRYWLPEISIITPSDLASDFSDDLAVRATAVVTHV